jgi:phosphopantothenoylcysteine decarboxylase / phosphopantothenate---cysteine ligase
MPRGNVLLLVSGGIAAYKACYLTRLLRQAGFSVKVAMTEAARRFVGPMTFQVLSENPVASDLWGEGQSRALDHVEYARWAHVAVIAPATANLLAKLAAGIADDICSTLLLAHPGPVVAAPAMNDNMWSHAATQANLAMLRERGVALVQPEEGWLACGIQGKGRMAEPETILVAVEDALAGMDPPIEATDPVRCFWAGKRVVVTAGPTREAIDAVRFLGNHSSGVMGAAIARRLVAMGAEVTLVLGPGSVAPPSGLSSLHPVTSAAQMSAAVKTSLARGCDWLFMAAAVADYMPQRPAETGKLKKEAQGERWTLELVRTPDILKNVAADRPLGLTVVGFALETDRLLEHAAAKLEAKNLDWIVANDPTGPGGGFGDVPHTIHLLDRSGEVWRNNEPCHKDRLAALLLDQLARASIAGGRMR